MTRTENNTTTLAVKLHDGSQKALEDAVVECWWMRPAQDGQDRHWKMQPKGGGLYEASGPLPEKGAWDVHVTVAQGAQQKQFVKSLVVE
jgi:nitrogen fixation protein FixH